MGKKKSFYEQDYLSHIGATILCASSFAAVSFLACGTPLGQLMLREYSRTEAAHPGVIFTRPCYTLWGMRNNCWNANYTVRVDDEQIAQCPDMRTRFEAAEAFSVVAMFALLFVLGGAWYKICGSDIKTVVTLIAIFAIGSTTVPFAVVTAFYYTPFCDLDFLTHAKTRFGAGYALTVTSFCVQAVGLILYLALEPEGTGPSPKADKSSDKKSSTSEGTSEGTSSGTSESH